MADILIGKEAFNHKGSIRIIF